MCIVTITDVLVRGAQHRHLQPCFNRVSLARATAYSPARQQRPFFMLDQTSVLHTTTVRHISLTVRLWQRALVRGCVLPRLPLHQVP